MSALLDVSGVTLRYKTPSVLVTATDRVSFQVNRSDRFVLLGPSGCGKSTLLKAVGGYLNPSEGHIRIKGREVTEPGADRMMVFQEFDQLLPWKTVLENVMFPLLVARKLPRKEAEDRAKAYIEKVNLTRAVDAYPHTLSGGMKQRVAIARGMAMEPDILLMDEPFAALYALTRRTCQDELLQLWEDTKVTVLFVTHSIAEAIKIGNRILLLSPHPGRVTAEVNDVDCVSPTDGSAGQLEKHIHELLFAEEAVQLGMTLMSNAQIVMRADMGQAQANTGEVERKLSTLELAWGNGFVRKTVIIIFLGIVWEAYGRYLDNPLLFPTLLDTLSTMADRVADGTLPLRAWTSLKVLLMGYASGVALAAILTILAINTRIGTDFLETVTAMFNPLPAIALLPLALIWFGLGNGSLVFILIHSVLWAVALNTHSGFLGVSQTLRMVGRNYGLKGLSYVFKILVPAAFPSILTGLKIGWAFAWRTLIAAELVFGVSSGQGGLGWFIFENRNLLDIPSVFAGLLTVIIIGLVVENLIFRTIERKTIRKWGLQS